MKHLAVTLFAGVALFYGQAIAAETRPNILLVMVDDMGFSDLGCYGSEIDTPNLDKLAAGGVRFTQFYNTAKCHSSRVSLLSGRWCQQAGDVRLSRAVTIPEVLAPAGYFTAMTGKWHLDKEPTDFGFQRYFGHLSGACSYFKGDKTFRLNGEPWSVPQQGFYTTVANVDHAIDFLGEARSEKKHWFLYIAFNAPHAPLQPMKVDYEKYLGRYDVGWDSIRAARVAKQKHLGILPSDTQESARPDHVRAWEQLTAEQKSWESHRMSAYAGLIDRVDQEMGRLVANLSSASELENTLIVFVSDNGACPYDRGQPEPNKLPYDPDTSWSDSTGWAWARNAPFRFYKQNQFEGGIATPAIMHWPAGMKQSHGTVEDSPAHLVDILPTVVEVAKAKLPQTFPGRQPTPLAGVSLLPILEGQHISSRPPIHLLFSSDRGLRDGDWKIVSFQSQPWELYRISVDRTELHDLAAQCPDILNRMVNQWHEITANTLMATGKNTQPVAIVAGEKKHREWTDYDSPLFGAKSKERSVKGTGKRKAARADATIPRARVGTQLNLENKQLILNCTGNDPGLAFEKLGDLPAGPYTLEFRSQSKASGDGEIYWTADAETLLPKGQRLEWPVVHDGQWHTQLIKIDTRDTLHSLRLDPCAGPGTVILSDIRLIDATGKTLKSWP